MKDILGREIHDGDICVGKGTGRYVKGMDVGIWDGNSIAFRGGGKRLMSDVFLVVNPSEEELKIKKEILDDLDKLKKAKEAKAALKAIPLGKLEVGGIYKNDSNSLYLYLGKRTVTLTDCDRRNEERVETGHCFMYVSPSNTDDDIIKNITRIYKSWHHGASHELTILKGAKKLVEFERKINLEFPMTNEVEERDYGRYSNDYHYKLVID